MELVVLVGLQASGKSSFCRERLAATHQLVSKDLMRNVRDKERRQAEQVEAALCSGQSVVVDNTNPGPAQRAPLVALGRLHGARLVAYYFDTEVSACMARNAQRQGRARVPPVAIHVTARKLVPPSIEEGFDALYRVRLVPEGFAVEPMGAAQEVETR